MEVNNPSTSMAKIGEPQILGQPKLHKNHLHFSKPNAQTQIESNTQDIKTSREKRKEILISMLVPMSFNFLKFSCPYCE